MTKIRAAEPGVDSSGPPTPYSRAARWRTWGRCRLRSRRILLPPLVLTVRRPRDRRILLPYPEGSVPRRHRLRILGPLLVFVGSGAVDLLQPWHRRLRTAKGRRSGGRSAPKSASPRSSAGGGPPHRARRKQDLDVPDVGLEIGCVETEV